MFSTDDGKRKLALALTHYVYRNTKVEDFHADNEILSASLYKKVYAIVKRRVNLVLKYQKYLNNLDNFYDRNKIKEIAHSINDSDRLGFFKYVGELSFNLLFKPNWDRAELLEVTNIQNPTQYILAGHFKECSLKNKPLNNQIMCYINKDIHNRIYTLICKKIF